MTPFFSTYDPGYSRVMKGSYYDNYYSVKKREGKEARYLRILSERLSHLEKFTDLDGKYVLDVGCGEGQLLRLLQSKGAQTKGIEPMHRVAAELERRGERVFAGLVEEYEHGEEAKFDVVVMYYVLDAMRDPVNALRHLRGMVADDGLLFVNVGSVYRKPLFSKFFTRLLRKPLHRFVPRRSSHDYHPHYFTRRTLAACVEAAGFQVLWISGKRAHDATFVARAGKIKNIDTLTVEAWPVMWASFFLWRIHDAAVRPLYDLAAQIYRAYKYRNTMKVAKT